MSNHRAFQLYAHITWHTWNRVGCLDEAAVVDLKSAVASACKKCAVHLLRGAVLANHVHLVISFQPETRLREFVRLAKSVAATRVNRRVFGAVRWARGYSAVTLHRKDLKRVIKYVAEQFQRHPESVPRSSRLGIS